MGGLFQLSRQENDLNIQIFKIVLRHFLKR